MFHPISLDGIEIEFIAAGDSCELGPRETTEWMNIPSVDAPGDKVDRRTTNRPGDQASMITCLVPSN